MFPRCHGRWASMELSAVPRHSPPLDAGLPAPQKRSMLGHSVRSNQNRKTSNCQAYRKCQALTSYLRGCGLLFFQVTSLGTSQQQQPSHVKKHEKPWEETAFRLQAFSCGVFCNKVGSRPSPKVAMVAVGLGAGLEPS